MKKPTIGKTRIVRQARRGWVPVAQIKVHPEAQRRLNPAWVKGKVSTFDIEALGLPVVCRDGDVFYCIDGQHRIALIRAVGWGDQYVECEVYDDLTLTEMAHEFLIRNSKTEIRTFDKFRIRITAEEETPVAIHRVVTEHGLVLSDQSRDGHVTAVLALERVYTGAGMTGGVKLGAPALDRTLGVIVAAWGKSQSGFVAPSIEGLGLVYLRYANRIETDALVKKLASISGGPSGLVGRARSLRDMRGGTVAQCLAGAVVEIYNRGRRVGKLESWWK